MENTTVMKTLCAETLETTTFASVKKTTTEMELEEIVKVHVFFYSKTL